MSAPPSMFSMPSLVIPDDDNTTIETVLVAPPVPPAQRRQRKAPKHFTFSTAHITRSHSTRLLFCWDYATPRRPYVPEASVCSKLELRQHIADVASIDHHEETDDDHSSDIVLTSTPGTPTEVQSFWAAGSGTSSATVVPMDSDHEHSHSTTSSPLQSGRGPSSRARGASHPLSQPAKVPPRSSGRSNVLPPVVVTTNNDTKPSSYSPSPNVSSMMASQSASSHLMYTPPQYDRTLTPPAPGAAPVAWASANTRRLHFKNSSSGAASAPPQHQQMMYHSQSAATLPPINTALTASTSAWIAAAAASVPVYGNVHIATYPPVTYPTYGGTYPPLYGGNTTMPVGVAPILSGSPVMDTSSSKKGHRRNSSRGGSGMLAAFHRWIGRASG